MGGPQARPPAANHRADSFPLAHSPLPIPFINLPFNVLSISRFKFGRLCIVKNENLPAIEHVRSTQNEWMTTEAAAYLRTKPRTLLKWVREGSIKAWPLHGAKRRTWRFRKEDLDASLGFAQTRNSDSVLFSKTSSVALQ